MHGVVGAYTATMAPACTMAAVASIPMTAVVRGATSMLAMLNIIKAAVAEAAGNVVDVMVEARVPRRPAGMAALGMGTQRWRKATGQGQAFDSEHTLSFHHTASASQPSTQTVHLMSARARAHLLASRRHQPLPVAPR